MAASSRAETIIRVRVPASARDLIDHAALVAGETRSAFLLESARRRAVDVLLGQNVLHLDPAASTAFAQALADPRLPTEALRKLLGAKVRWSD